MKKILAAFGLLVFGGSICFADDNIKPEMKIWVEGRADLINQSIVTLANTTVNPAGNTLTTNRQDFEVNALKPNISGKVSDNLSYRVRLNVVKVPATNRDNTTGLLEIASVEDKLFDNFSLKMGKLLILQQEGWESVYAFTDVFTFSGVFTGLNANFGYYRTGVEGKYKFGDQNFFFNIVTPTTALNDTAGTNQTNLGLGYALYYQGSFLDNMIQPIVSYSLFNVDGNYLAATPTNTVTDTLFAVGVRVVPIPGLKIDVDFDNLTLPFATANVTGNPTVTQTIHSRAEYRYGKFVPNVTYFTDTFSSSATATQFTDKYIEGSLWYYPYENVNFRYELSYGSLVTTFDPTATTTTTTACRTCSSVSTTRPASSASSSSRTSRVT